jgi:hypothetical protein
MQISKIPQLLPIQGKGLEAVLSKQSEEAIDLIKQLLQYSPLKRKDPFVLLQHRFFDVLRESRVTVEGNPVVDLFDFNETEIGGNRKVLEKLLPKYK